MVCAESCWKGSEARRHDPNHGVGRASEINRPADNGRVTAKNSLPQPVAEDRQRRPAGYILRSRKLTSDDRLDTEYMKEISADALLLNIFHAPGCEKIDPGCRTQDRAVQKRCVVTHNLPLHSSLTRIDLGGAVLFVYRADHHEALRVGIWKGAEKE